MKAYRSILSVLAAVVLLGACVYGQGHMISVKFGYSAHQVNSTAGAPGFTANHWNNFYSTSGSHSNLIDSSGSSTPTDLSWSTDEIWRRDLATQATADLNLYASFMNDKPPSSGLTSDDPGTVTFTNLPADFVTDGYRVVIYSDGDEAKTDGRRQTVFDISDGIVQQSKIVTDIAQFPSVGYKLDAGGNWQTTQDDADWGTYAVFDGFSGSTLTIDFYAIDGVSGRGHFNGVQIVKNSPLQSVDFNGDGLVDTSDLAVVALGWLSNDTLAEGNIDQAGRVDYADYSFLAGLWTGPDTEAPSVVQNLQTIFVASTTLSFSWEAATDNLAVVGYNIYRDGVLHDTTAFTDYSDSNLTENTTYQYQVTALDDAGNESALSSVLEVTTPVTPPPTNLVVNGSFEDGGTYPSDWTQKTHAVRDTALAVDGSASLYVSGPSGGSTYISQNMDVMPNTEYRMSYYGRTDAPVLGKDTAVVRVSGSGLGTTYGPYIRNDTDGWQLFQQTFVTGSITHSIRMDILYEMLSTDEVWFDNVSLLRISDPGTVSQDSASTDVQNAISLNFDNYPQDHFFGPGPVAMPTIVENGGSGSLTVDVITEVLTYVPGRTYSMVVRDEQTVSIPAGSQSNVTASFAALPAAGPYKFTIEVRYQGKQAEKTTGTLFYDISNWSLPDYEPADFDTFWADTLTTMRSRALNPTMPSPMPENQFVEISFNGYQGPFHDRVRGFLSKPDGIAPGEKVPAILMLPGAGYGTAPLDSNWVNKGFVALAFSVHDLPFLDGRYHFSDAYPVDQVEQDKYGVFYMEAGLDNRDDYFYHAAYANAVRAVDFLKSLPYVDETRIMVAGGSQGGALTTAVAGLVPDIALAVANSPGRARWDKLTYEYRAVGTFEPPAGSDRQTMFEDVLVYCDSSIHARRIQCPALYLIPLQDDIDPAALQYYLFTEITQSPDKRFVVNPFGGHLAVSPGTLEDDMIELYIGAEYAD